MKQLLLSSALILSMVGGVQATVKTIPVEEVMTSGGGFSELQVGQAFGLGLVVGVVALAAIENNKYTCGDTQVRFISEGSNIVNEKTLCAIQNEQGIPNT